MSAPVDLGDVPTYSGDPLDLSIVLDGEDHIDKVFTSQIRHRRPDTDELMRFDVSVQVITGDPEITDGSTQINLHLDGDTGEGALDGFTRLLERTTVFDLQMQDPTGPVVETVATGRLVRTEDVTR